MSWGLMGLPPCTPKAPWGSPRILGAHVSPPLHPPSSMGVPPCPGGSWVSPLAPLPAPWGSSFGSHSPPLFWGLCMPPGCMWGSPLPRGGTITPLTSPRLYGGPPGFGEPRSTSLHRGGHGGPSVTPASSCTGVLLPWGGAWGPPCTPQPSQGVALILGGTASPHSRVQEDPRAPFPVMPPPKMGGVPFPAPCGPTVAQCTPHSSRTRGKPPQFILQGTGRGDGGTGGGRHPPLTPWCCTTAPCARKWGSS